MRFAQQAASGPQAGDGPYVYAPGLPLVRGRTEWPETLVYNYWGGTHLLVRFLKRPTPSEVAGMKAGGRIDVGFVVLNETILMAMDARTARQQADSPFSLHLVPKAARVVPPVIEPGEMKAVVQTVLVDAATGIVRTARLSTFSNEFSRALHDAIRKQGREAFNERRHDANIERLYAMYPTIKSLMRAAVARTTLGE